MTADKNDEKLNPLIDAHLYDNICLVNQLYAIQAIISVAINISDWENNKEYRSDIEDINRKISNLITQIKNKNSNIKKMNSLVKYNDT